MGVFRFKQFSVDQHGCAMKINTDGVLLAVLCDMWQSSRVLDIGTGTGVIALMLAQRNEHAQLYAVEIDESSAQTAQSNAISSPFSSRIQVIHGDFQDFTTETKLDLIVSNPPFFVDSLQNPDLRKGISRHTDLDFFDRMFDFAKHNLSADGAIEMIVPHSLVDDLAVLASKSGLSLQRQILIRSFATSEVIRHILRYTKAQVVQTNIQKFVIYQEKGIYTREYRDLLQPFFIHY